MAMRILLVKLWHFDVKKQSMGKNGNHVNTTAFNPTFTATWKDPRHVRKNCHRGQQLLETLLKTVQRNMWVHPILWSIPTWKLLKQLRSSGNASVRGNNGGANCRFNIWQSAKFWDAAPFSNRGLYNCKEIPQKEENEKEEQLFPDFFLRMSPSRFLVYERTSESRWLWRAQNKTQSWSLSRAGCRNFSAQPVVDFTMESWGPWVRSMKKLNSSERCITWLVNLFVILIEADFKWLCWQLQPISSMLSPSLTGCEFSQ